MIYGEGYYINLVERMMSPALLLKLFPGEPIRKKEGPDTHGPMSSLRPEKDGPLFL